MCKALPNLFELINQCLFELKLPIPGERRFREPMTTMGDKSPSDITKSEPTVLTLEAKNSDINLGDAYYERKVQLLNDALQKVGMGWHQWVVLFLTFRLNLAMRLRGIYCLITGVFSPSLGSGISRALPLYSPVNQ